MEKEINTSYHLTSGPRMALSLLLPYVEIHASLFPRCTGESQMVKYEEEFGEYEATDSVEKALKELGDCLIVAVGIMRFYPMVGACIADNVFHLATFLGKTPSDMMVYVSNKFAINQSRVWKFDEETKTYHHVGVDGNE